MAISCFSQVWRGFSLRPWNSGWAARWTAGRADGRTAAWADSDSGATSGRHPDAPVLQTFCKLTRWHGAVLIATGGNNQTSEARTGQGFRGFGGTAPNGGGRT